MGNELEINLFGFFFHLSFSFVFVEEGGAVIFLFGIFFFNFSAFRYSVRSV